MNVEVRVLADIFPVSSSNVNLLYCKHLTFNHCTQYTYTFSLIFFSVFYKNIHTQTCFLSCVSYFFVSLLYLLSDIPTSPFLCFCFSCFTCYFVNMLFIPLSHTLSYPLHMYQWPATCISCICVALDLLTLYTITLLLYTLFDVCILCHTLVRPCLVMMRCRSIYSDLSNVV